MNNFPCSEARINEFLSITFYLPIGSIFTCASYCCNARLISSFLCHDNAYFADILGFPN
jgi:hypothetical protein